MQSNIFLCTKEAKKGNLNENKMYLTRTTKAPNDPTVATKVMRMINTINKTDSNKVIKKFFASEWDLVAIFS